MSVLEWGNPYTHEEYWRESLVNTDRSLACTWCGQRPARLYRYGTGRFFVSRSHPPKAFCNLSCANAYEPTGGRGAPR